MSFVYLIESLLCGLQDVAGKILSFAQKGPRGICVLSANGAVSNVTIRQPGSSGGILTYEACSLICAFLSRFLLHFCWIWACKLERVLLCYKNKPDFDLWSEYPLVHSDAGSRVSSLHALMTPYSILYVWASVGESSRVGNGMFYLRTYLLSWRVVGQWSFLLLPVRRNSWVKSMHFFPLLYHLLS